MKTIERTMPIGTFDQTIKDVCVPCNGWMEQQLEAKVRPYLVPIFEGNRPRLTYGPQVTLAAWAWKTAAMIMLLTDRKAHVISREEYAWFRKRRTPPYRSLVWIGSYEEEDRYRNSWFPWTTSFAPRGEALPYPVRNNVYSVGFTVGPVFFLVFGTSVPAMPPLAPRGRLSERVRPLWPTSPGSAFCWPPGEAVERVLLDEFRESCIHLGPGKGLVQGIPGEVYGPLK